MIWRILCTTSIYVPLYVLSWQPVSSVPRGAVPLDCNAMDKATPPPVLKSARIQNSVPVVPPAKHGKRLPSYTTPFCLMCVYVCVCVCVCVCVFVSRARAEGWGVSTHLPSTACSMAVPQQRECPDSFVLRCSTWRGSGWAPWHGWVNADE